MNNRDYKKFAPNTCYHIYNRGSGKQDIFLDDDDKTFFLFRLKENLFPGNIYTHGRYTPKALAPNSFSLLCYCLMPNHFHFLIKQQAETPISALILKVFTSYSKYFNKKYNRIGPLFQDTYKATPVLTDTYLCWLSAYIHNNPKTDNIVNNLLNYPWSSYLDYFGIRNGTLCNKEFVLSQFPSINNYKDFVEQAEILIKQRKDLKHLLLDS